MMSKDIWNVYESKVNFICDKAISMLSNQEKSAGLSILSLTEALEPSQESIRDMHEILLQHGVIIGHRDFDLAAVIKLAMDKGISDRKFFPQEVDGIPGYMLFPDFEYRS